MVIESIRIQSELRELMPASIKTTVARFRYTDFAWGEEKEVLPFSPRTEPT